MKRKFRSYEESLLETLKNHDEALAYLNAALQEEDPKIFLLALKDVLLPKKLIFQHLQKSQK